MGWGEGAPEKETKRGGGERSGSERERRVGSRVRRRKYGMLA